MFSSVSLTGGNVSPFLFIKSSYIFLKNDEVYELRKNIDFNISTSFWKSKDEEQILKERFRKQFTKPAFHDLGAIS